MIFAIDPGTTESAYVEMDGDRILSFGMTENVELLALIMTLPESTSLVIEQIKHYGSGMPVGASVFETCIWIGRFIQAFRSHCVTLLPRSAIKSALSGDARAKDANIRQAIIDRYGGKEKAIGKKASPGPLYGISSHCWAALAVALTYKQIQTK